MCMYLSLVAHQPRGQTLDYKSTLKHHLLYYSAYAPENRRIRAGATNLESGGVIVHIAQEINHPSYGLNGNDGDISVVRLSSALILTPNNPSIAVGSIVAAGSTMFGNMPVTKVGWGITEVRCFEVGRNCVLVSSDS